MHKPQKNTLYNTKCHSKNQAQVFEYCLSEEESDLQSTVAPTPQKTANNSIHTKASWQKAHSRMGSNVTSDSLNDCPLYVQDKENIYDKPRDYYLKNVQTLLNHKANVSPLRPQGIKAINELANQGNNMAKIRPNLEASYASELLSHLDVNIQEFRNLLANNLNKLGPKEKSLFENAQANDDSKVLEISRLTLRLEESKFCTENEPSELKLLKEFETAHSHPTNCSLLERSLDENKAPDLTESIQFDKPWNMTEQRSNYCSGTVQVANTGYTSNHNFFTDGAYRTEEQAQYRSSQGRDRSRSRSPIFLGRKTPCENDTSAFDIFQEDYESMFETFKRIMPDLSSKSHIIRYLKGHDSLGSEFLYAVMLDLKEIEKNVFLMHHQSTTREKYLQDQVNEMGKLSSQNLESPHWKARGEKTTERRDAKSSRGDSGVITMYMRKHYQSLIQKLNNFYGQKLEILKESVQNEEKYAINKDSIEDVAEDLEEELGIEEMQGLLRENLRKVKEVNDLIGEIWKERKDAENVDSENEGRNKQEQGVKSDGMRKLSVDSGSTGFMTTIRCDGFEGRKEDMGVEESYERYRGEEEQETRLNMSEVEMLRVEGLLKEKENEINIIRKKEQMYQNMIFKLTQELKEAKKMNMLNSQEKTSQ